ncbi:glycosyltransferase family 4 protein [Marinilabilia salmonicolor]|jgi:UDP-N-acetylmuramyl pentapeptide phosphotransferase/UDP-N-acetylglucosamine-1-phosphate transferase|uniref:UDP-N-acetylmuramyl pentapeptide phosphotransferase/UDP-N-acetylglucosamine-1-phosphate transferase n=2 Tax=Marinilabilia salmonicolor TaxID=989 RepID=A0A368UMS8_9BACT|nr:MraY family glycosyltransferase [Marinilabilia salmonicolor]RCW27479.1 UDP-N-acetylmuramyl pentapeptide phosphotransferase/UDP-N-acetylglucosamine-1-phosphate transferase [Marinilabilia salmonicolor]
MIDYSTILMVLFAAMLSFLLVFLSIPTILRVSHAKNLFDEPGKRRIHKQAVPNLGGLGIFIGILFTYSLYIDWFDIRAVPFIIPALLVIFSIGIKDDIMITAPMVKLLGQILAAFIIVGFGDLRLTDFHGFFGLQPDYFSSMAISILFVIFIVNGFNLIDGVDGLATISGMISILAFSGWFFLNGNFHISTLGAIVLGALLAFLYYNVFSKKQKIFMGDTGSMIIGFILATMALQFMEANAPAVRSNLNIQMISAPAVVVGILIVPVIDTLRVFFLRLSKGNSPFVADKNHIHHRLLTLGFSHIQIALILGGVNIFFIVLNFLLKDFGMLKLMVLNLVLGFVIFYLPAMFIRIKLKKLRNDQVEVTPSGMD